MKYVPILFLWLVASLQLAGCIMLPLPPLGAQIGLEEIEKLELGVSTREQVHDALGEPNVAITDRYEIFDVSEESFNILFVAIGIAGGAALAPMNASFYRVLAEYQPDGVLHDLRWEGTDEVLSPEPIPSRTWPNPLQWAGYRPTGGSVTVTINPSRNGRLLAVSDTSTHSIAFFDGQSGNLVTRVEAIAGCRPFGVRPRALPWYQRAQVTVRSRGAATTVFLGDDEHLASIAEGDTICIWNANTQTHLGELSGQGGTWGIVAARSAPIVASINNEYFVDTWDGSNASNISSIAVCRGRCTNLEMKLSDDGQILATAHDHYEPGFFSFPDSVIVRLWGTKTGAELAAFATSYSDSLRFRVPKIALSPDLRHVALVHDWHVEVWRIDQTTELAGEQDVPENAAGWNVQLERVMMSPFVAQVRKGVVPYVAFSADGRKLAAGYGSALVWEVDTWREIWRAPSGYSERPEAFREGFVFTSDGRHIITQCCSWDVPELDESQPIANLPRSGH